MISDIDFEGMSFSEIKLVLSVCVGVAVAIVSTVKGVEIIYSAVVGFATGAILFAVIAWAIGQL
jgi:hypothetical protein